jgi:hypothetical protein
MDTDLRNAEQAISRGRNDEALQLLWNALEQARLSQDRESLAAILHLARRLEGHEAEHLAAAVERVLPDIDAPPDGRQRSSGWKRGAVIATLLVVAAFARVRVGLPLLTGPVGPQSTRTRTPRRRLRSPSKLLASTSCPSAASRQ